VESVKATFPLSGEWWVGVSPADRVPSHYTNKFAMTYAYDFVKYQDLSISLFNRLSGQAVSTCESWNESVLSPCNGEVVSSVSHVMDRTRLSVCVDYLSALKALFARSTHESLTTVFGNHLILKSDSVHFLLAHLKHNSTTVQAGQEVVAGQQIAAIGHNGSSVFPHLHFHAMDGPNPNKARGTSVCFDLLLKAGDAEWESRDKLIPCRGNNIKVSSK